MKLGIRDGHPAVCVKDRHLWARELPGAYEILSESEIDAIYEGVAFDFWQVWAPSLASDYGYEIGQAGRSGGWLTVAGAGTGFEGAVFPCGFALHVPEAVFGQLAA